MVADSAPLWAGQTSLERDRDNGSGLAGASFEELMNMETSSMERKRQKVSHTAAAVFVITQDDIAHSGAVSLPEVLRLAPGLRVARLDGSKWAISSRGFNGRFASNRIHAAVLGHILGPKRHPARGHRPHRSNPGATAWGANAVNGVIDIITKPRVRQRVRWPHSRAAPETISTSACGTVARQGNGFTADRSAGPWISTVSIATG